MEKQPNRNISQTGSSLKTASPELEINESIFDGRRQLHPETITDVASVSFN
jgi:hypothetical protein